MQKILVSLPDSLADRMRATIPARQRSKIIAKYIELEVERREKELYQCALDVEADKDLNAEMTEWDTTIGDGLESEPW